MKRQYTIAAISIGLVGIFAAGASVSAANPTVNDTASLNINFADLTAAKARCDAAIVVRQAELSKLTHLADAAQALSSGHHSTVVSMLSTSTSGLAALKTKIDGDTDAATLKTDCQSIMTGYRVFALRSPQVHLAIVGDRESALVGKGNTAATKLDAAIQKAAGNGKDVTDATAKLADMKAKLADAASLLNGVVDHELTFTPDQWNSNHDVLKSSGTALRSAGDDLKTAFADAKAIVADLKA
jgi:hypothetical protein